MPERPALDKRLDSKTFRAFYYLKEELVDFCRTNRLPTSGGKAELTERIACYLDTGRIQPVSKARKKHAIPAELCEDTIIEADFVCSEKHRAFFKEHIGACFSFKVAFQRWLKSNAGKTYRDAIAAYHQITEQKETPVIEQQFEYNTYIHDFFADNKGRTLEEAIVCWNEKKQRPGCRRYESSDLAVLAYRAMPQSESGSR